MTEDKPLSLSINDLREDGGFIEVIIYNVPKPCSLYRFEPSKPDSLVCLIKDVREDLIFRDYTAEPGREYDYTVESKH